MSFLYLILFICLHYAKGDPCVVPGVTWDTVDILDILEDVADYTTCQYSCASLDQAQCSSFTWYNSEHQDNALTCIFFLSSSPAPYIPCDHCISGPAICPSQDLLFIGDSLLLELPSFNPAVCSIASYPERGIQYAFTGEVEGRHLVCGGRGADGSLLSTCYSLHGNSWSKEEDLIEARSGSAASSTPGGLMVTGGYGAEGYLSSSEVFKDNKWVPGPSLPLGVEGHCQVQMDNTVVVVGGFMGSMPSGGAYLLEEETWQSIGDLSTPRGWHACSFKEDKLYVMGGYNGTYLSSTEVLDLTTGTWHDGPGLPYPAYNGLALQYDGELYLVGGYGSDGKVVRLSPEGDAWEEVAESGWTGTRTWAPAPVFSSGGINC